MDKIRLGSTSLVHCDLENLPMRDTELWATLRLCLMHRRTVTVRSAFVYSSERTDQPAAFSIISSSNRFDSPLANTFRALSK